MALCLAWPTTPLKIWTGNPVIWCMAAMSVAIVYRWAAPFVLLKPSLFPFAFFGIRERAWWIGLAVFVAVCVPFGALWADWIVSVLNSRGSGLAVLACWRRRCCCCPLVAWLGRTRQAHRHDSATDDQPAGALQTRDKARQGVAGPVGRAYTAGR